MATVKDITNALETLADPALKMDFDNVGFLAGFGGTEVQKVLVTLDITSAVIDEAIAIGAQLIVSHHPLFFSLKTVTDETVTGRKLTKLLRAGLSAICMHTNLDAAVGGVNDALASVAGLTQITNLLDEAHDSAGTPHAYGRVGYLAEPTPLVDYLSRLKKSLKTNGLRYHDAGRPVYKIATVGGSGGSYLEEAITQGCDTLVTSDVKYDVFLDAREQGINLIDGDHFCTENVVTPTLQKKLTELFPELDIIVSSQHSQTAQFYC